MNGPRSKTAIIIGASSGIGLELAKLMSDDGYILGLAARRLGQLEKLSAELPRESFVRQMDVTDAGDAGRGMAELIDRLGAVDLVVISAGTGHINPELDFAPEADTIATNVTGFTQTAGIAFKHFLSAGSGHLVGLSSIAALRGAGEAPAYNASKAYVSNYLQGLRHKAAKSGADIVVTDIQAGLVDTEMAKGDGLFWVMPVGVAARQIFSAIRRRRKHAYITRRWRLIAWILKILPEWVYVRM